MDPAFHRDPHAAYRWMRANAPVYWDASAPLHDGAGAWGITRHADILSVSTRHKLFSSAGGSRPDAPPVPSMINMDPPAHTARRAINRERFTAKAVKRYEDTVRRVAVDLIERVSGCETCDLVHDLAMPLPMRVIGRMMELPEDDYTRLLHWSDLIATGLANQPPEFEAEVLAAADAFERYITGWFSKREAAPGDDILSAIVHAKIDGQPLGQKDRIHESLLLLVGGDETTRHVLTGGLVALLEHPEQLEALRADAALLPRAIEEMLRWVTPVKTLARTATADCTLGGEDIIAGDRVILLFESGNRDEAAFTDPDRFDIRREPNQHVAFGGYGRHHCLGAHLARLEIRVMLEEMLTRLPNLRRADDAPIEKRYGTFVLGYERVPLRL